MSKKRKEKKSKKKQAKEDPNQDTLPWEHHQEGVVELLVKLKGVDTLVQLLEAVQDLLVEGCFVVGMPYYP